MDSVLPYSSTSRPPERNKWLTYAMNLKPRQRSQSVDPVTAKARSKEDVETSHSNENRNRTQFYDELYKKYPKAFQRKTSDASTTMSSRSSRSLMPVRASRKLFNNSVHVHFDDEIDGSVYSERKLPSCTRSTGREIYRDCLTSPTPSMVSNSSVKQRLHATSDTLHYLLHHQRSPNDRNRQHRNYHNLYEKSHYMPLNSERLQRDLYTQNVDKIEQLEQELEWKEKQLKKFRRKLEYDHPVNELAESFSNTNFIDTNWNLNFNSDSPPDSAIDIDTMSLQSHVSMDTVSVLINEINIDDTDTIYSSKVEGHMKGQGHRYDNDDPTSLPLLLSDLYMAQNIELEDCNERVPKPRDITLTHRDSDVDSGIAHTHTVVTEMESMDTNTSTGQRDLNETCTEQEEDPNNTARPTMKNQTKLQLQPLKADHSLQIFILSDESNEDDDSIKQELLTAKMSRDLKKYPEFHSIRESLPQTLEDVDDSDPRLGIPKSRGDEREVAERYHRRRSPSPYFLGKSKFIVRSRPQSAPLFGVENKMKIVNISTKQNGELTENLQNKEFNISEFNGNEINFQNRGTSCANAYVPNRVNPDKNKDKNSSNTGGQTKGEPIEIEKFDDSKSPEKPNNSRTSSLSSNSTLSDSSFNSLILSSPRQTTEVGSDSVANSNKLTSQSVVYFPQSPLSSENDVNFDSPRKGSYSPLGDELNFSKLNHDQRGITPNYPSSKENELYSDGSESEIVTPYVTFTHLGETQNSLVLDNVREEDKTADGGSEMERNIGHTGKNGQVQYTSLKTSPGGSLLGHVQSSASNREYIDRNEEFMVSPTDKKSRNSELTFSSGTSDIKNVSEEEKLISYDSGLPDENMEELKNQNYVKLSPFESNRIQEGSERADDISFVKLTPYEAAISLDDNGFSVDEIIESDSDDIYSAKRVVLDKPKKHHTAKARGPEVLCNASDQIVHHSEDQRSDNTSHLLDISLNSSKLDQHSSKNMPSYEGKEKNINFSKNSHEDMTEKPKNKFANQKSTCDKNTVHSQEADGIKTHVDNKTTHKPDHIRSHVTDKPSSHMISHVTSELPDTSEQDVMGSQESGASPRNSIESSQGQTNSLSNNHQRIDYKIVSMDTDEDGTCLPENNSNLAKSKGLSASKQSLTDKMGNFKKSAKGKFKAIRKAVSMDRGLNKPSQEIETSTSPPPPTKHAKGKMPKMKKALSLKTLFGKKKSKHGSVEFLDQMSPSTPVDDPLYSGDKSSALSAGTSNQPVGKLHQCNPDGTQIIELNRPEHGPLGIYIARGNQHFQHGIFISRFTEQKKSLAGLVNIGDEILEINGIKVSSMGLDDVYSIMATKTTMVMKILPLLARKDV